MHYAKHYAYPLKTVSECVETDVDSPWLRYRCSFEEKCIGLQLPATETQTDYTLMWECSAVGGAAPGQVTYSGEFYCTSCQKCHEVKNKNRMGFI